MPCVGLSDFTNILVGASRSPAFVIYSLDYMPQVRTPEAFRHPRIKWLTPCCLPGWDKPVGYLNDDDFGANYPVLFARPAIPLSTLRSACHQNTTQDSVYGCLLNFAIVATPSDQNISAFRGANPTRPRDAVANKARYQHERATDAVLCFMKKITECGKSTELFLIEVI